MVFELTVQRLLQAHNYNSVGNFISFYEEFKNSKETNLANFMVTYKPLITDDHHTCVGLGLTLLDQLKCLDDRWPGLASKLYIASCEEDVKGVDACVQSQPDPFKVQKEHVLVALKVNISGRKGVLLLDPGYHVARVVTTMEDKSYPHTGWFRQSKEEHCTKYYNYTLEGGFKHVVWSVKERRGDSPEKLTHNVVYVAQPFLNPVDVTERRNLVYNFRSLLSRDLKGQLTSGIYFSISKSSPKQFTTFYQQNEVKERKKFSFDEFNTKESVENSNLQMMIEITNQMLHFPPGQLSKILQQLGNILSDSSFVNQVLLMNEKINNMEEDGIT